MISKRAWVLCRYLIWIISMYQDVSKNLSHPDNINIVPFNTRESKKVLGWITPIILG